jgi:hypothetical protein
MRDRVHLLLCRGSGLSAFLLLSGSAFQATLHDAAHHAFMTLPAYAISRADEVKLSGERDNIAYLRHDGTHPQHDADSNGEEELVAQFHIRRMEEKMNDRWNERRKRDAMGDCDRGVSRRIGGIC